MKIAFIVFDGITWLDLVGLYDAITRLKSGNFLPAIEWNFCAYALPAKDVYGLEMKPWSIAEPLNGYDALVVPGGHGTRSLINDEHFLGWIKTGADAKYKISICTGSLILGAAGFLKTKRATTNFMEYDTLKPYCREVSHDRIVEDGDTITAGAVSASIDLGLYLCEKWAGKDVREQVRRKMNYS